MVSKGEMWVLTRTASRSHIVKSGQAHIGLITASRSHIKAYLRCNRPAAIWNSEFFFPSFSVNAKFIMLYFYRKTHLAAGWLHLRYDCAMQL